MYLRTRQRATLGWAVPVVATALIASFGASPASADPTKNPDEAISVVDRALRSQPQPQPQTRATNTRARVDLPTPGKNRTTITNEGGKSLRVDLPGGAVVQRNGRTVSSGPDHAIVVDKAPAGARHAVVIPDSQAPTSQTYRLSADHGLTPKLQRDGSVDLIVPSEAGRLVVGRIDAPWAVDANGKKLATAFKLDGLNLTQTTDTTAAAFPTVVDPRISFGWGVYLSMNGFELNASRLAAATVIGGGSYALCTSPILAIPAVVNRVITVMCNAGYSAAAWQIFQSLRDDPTPWDTSTCYQRRIVPMDDDWTVVSNDECQWNLEDFE